MMPFFYLFSVVVFLLLFFIFFLYSDFNVNLFILCSPKVVKIGKKYAVHRNFGLSMQVSGYVHGYVMDVFAAALMAEEFDNTAHYDGRRPTFLRYILQHDVAVSLITF